MESEEEEYHFIVNEKDSDEINEDFDVVSSYLKEHSPEVYKVFKRMAYLAIRSEARKYRDISKTANEWTNILVDIANGKYGKRRRKAPEYLQPTASITIYIMFGKLKERKYTEVEFVIATYDLVNCLIDNLDKNIKSYERFALVARIAILFGYYSEKKDLLYIGTTDDMYQIVKYTLKTKASI